MNKDIKIDGLKKETFLLDEQEKIVLKEEVNIDSHIKHNKIFIITMTDILNQEN